MLTMGAPNQHFGNNPATPQRHSQLASMIDAHLEVDNMVYDQIENLVDVHAEEADSLLDGSAGGGEQKVITPQDRLSMAESWVRNNDGEAGADQQ